MKKGYLDVEKLKNMKKDELQELAHKLGVSDEGTKEEIAKRCAAIEVDMPEDDEQKPETVEVEVVETYKDLELRKILKQGTRLSMSTDRANYLVNRELVKVVEG